MRIQPRIKLLIADPRNPDETLTLTYQPTAVYWSKIDNQRDWWFYGHCIAMEATRDGRLFKPGWHWSRPAVDRAALKPWGTNLVIEFSAANRLPI
jgi:hypothetical protein